MRILFADDSMTAQNMGKKILTEAGYEVVAVSNGAAAVKKIAEQKPDIIILDIYMPGYTGLEVCDKVRSSVETLKTPVLLTVGKMEPYRTEDANRVKADGVIIKPFEASDLLAVVKKLEERIVPKTVAITEQTVMLERPPEFAEFPATESPVKEAEHDKIVDAGENTVAATVDVPDSIAGAAAFGDLLSPDPVAPPTFSTPPASIESAMDLESVMDIEEAMSTEIGELPAVPESSAKFSASAVETGEFSVSATEPVKFSALAADLPPGPAMDASESNPPLASEPASVYSASEFNVVSADDASTIPRSSGVHAELSPPVAGDDFDMTGPVSELEVQRTSAPPSLEAIPGHYEFEVEDNATPVEQSDAFTVKPVELEPTAAVSVPQGIQSTYPVEFETANSPTLESESDFAAAAPVEFEAFPANPEVKVERIEPIAPVAESQPAEIELAVSEPVLSISDAPAKSQPAVEDDFEARVAAAMSMYDEPAMEEPAAELVTTVIQPTQAPAVPEALKVEPLLEEPVEEQVEPEPVPEPYSFEYSPPIAVPPAPEKVVESVAAIAVAEIPNSMEEISVKPAEAVTDGALTDVALTDVALMVENESLSVSTIEESRAWDYREAPVMSQEPVAAPVEDWAHDSANLGTAEISAMTTAAVPSVRAVTNDEQMIASVVDRVLERLRPHLIEEISRELKNRKQA
jgi:CheY-like chemotaxis protein